MWNVKSIRECNNKYNVNLCDEIKNKSNDYIKEKFNEKRFIICTVYILVEEIDY